MAEELIQCTGTGLTIGPSPHQTRLSALHTLNHTCMEMERERLGERESLRERDVVDNIVDNIVDTIEDNIVDDVVDNREDNIVDYI
jgi:hypothetical protein